jgi:hypothetical protein
MDGVAVDFIGGVLKLFGTTFDEIRPNWVPGEYGVEKALGISRSKLTKRVTEEGVTFWANLEPFPWAHDLYKACRFHAPVCILTDPGMFALASEGKVDWLNKHFGQYAPSGKRFEEYILTPRKHYLAKPDTLLIDDKDTKIVAFEGEGGQAILFPRHGNSLHALHDKAYETVREEIKQIFKEK